MCLKSTCHQPQAEKPFTVANHNRQPNQGGQRLSVGEPTQCSQLGHEGNYKNSTDGDQQNIRGSNPWPAASRTSLSWPASSRDHGGHVSWVYGTLLLSLLVQPASAEITKPFGEWICNYCAMGPQENPDDCGTPILCGFYGLLLFIILLTIYSTIKGSTE